MQFQSNLLFFFVFVINIPLFPDRFSSLISEYISNQCDLLLIGRSGRQSIMPLAAISSQILDLNSNPMDSIQNVEMIDNIQRSQYPIDSIQTADSGKHPSCG